MRDVVKAMSPELVARIAEGLRKAGLPEGCKNSPTRRGVLHRVGRRSQTSGIRRWAVGAERSGVRLGEPTAARVGWFNPRTSMIEVDDPRHTKAHKRHAMPIIDCLRVPMLRLVDGRDRDEYLFADAPRPANPKIPISHETSKWFSRYFDRLKIGRVFHELRHTWIEEARH